ncbi:vanillate O-demethylase monooxygenase subunit [Sphingobium sp. JAI105]|uniref:aromatic ring-hydroxylating dioxygenase subunit alpha n=1 Tax=Sphingobium sp. JAI105 TaxID=2787715 RepID=UPI0018CA38AA|nr:aromatic ring-hydroxylating dioxygenase subunit alpha [Sphingobium sp. JAI105]MBG6118501.1 vanillate O-demethylase monooxygenase subunit [Sphingobium sp. JAI105]
MSGLYLLNCWYLAAWAGELAPGAHLRRTLLDQPVLLMRSDAGKVAAIGDVCPHRFASLSEGKFESGIVECPYHGLRFDMDGRCVHNPHGDGKIPERARVRSYTVAERHGAIWFWPGDPDIANPSDIPNFSFLDGPSVGTGGYLLTKANYQLMCDNIMDLSHADFLHRTTLGTEGDIARASAKAQMEGDVVTIKWAFDGKGMVMNRLPDDPIDVHTEFEVTWHAPGAMILRSSSYPIGVEGEQGHIVGGHKRVSAHIMTPESEYRTHYFFNTTDAGRVERIGKVFELEDGAMLEEVQCNMRTEKFWDLAPLILSSDRGAVMARRALERRIRREQETIAPSNSIAAADHAE